MRATRQATATGRMTRSARTISSAATAARASCAGSSASRSSGDANLLQLRQALYRCDDLYERIPIGKGRHYHVADAQSLVPDRAGLDPALHPAFGGRDRPRHGAMFEKVCAMPVDYEMLYVGQWRQNLLLADRYAERRVFLAGDAAHLMIPTGGLGMNTGVGDADRSGLEARRDLAGLGRPAAAAVLRDRAPAGRRAQRRGLALRDARAGESGAPRIGRTSATIRRRARKRAPTWRASPMSSSASRTR